jgi:hypothetical protein
VERNPPCVGDDVVMRKGGGTDMNVKSLELPTVASGKDSDGMC